MKNTTNQQKRFLICFSLFWLFLSTSSFALSADSSDVPPITETNPQLESVSLQLKWLDQFQFAGYYAAKIKGFYKDEGLDVTIKPRDVFVNNIQQVIDGKSEYGIADSIIFLYLSRGAAVSIVAPIFQHSPQVFIALKSSGIKSLYDLADKNISFYNKDTDGFPLLSMLYENDIVPNLNRVVIKTGPDMLLTGQVQAFPGYLSNEPYFFKNRGIKINTINPMNYGVDLYGDILFTNQNESTNHPDRVARFKRASIKGWQYALSHKEEIINYIINDLKAPKSFRQLMYEANVIEEAIQPNSIPIGTLDEGRFKYIEKLFIKHNLINNKLDFSKSIYQQETDKLVFTQKEIDWIKAHPQIKVAIDPDWAPIDFVNKKGEYQGIANEYFTYIHSITSLEFTPKKGLSWQESLQQVKEHKLDMFAGMVATPDRSKYLVFTNPYLKLPMVIATKKGHDFIKDLKLLGNATIATVKGYAAEELLKKNYPKLKIMSVNTPQEGLLAVSQGKALGYVDNIAVVAYHIRSGGLANIQISGETPFRADVTMAIRKDWPELQSIINKILDSMDEDTREQFKDSWLKVDYKTEIEWRRVIIIVVPILLFALLILLYNRKLKNLNLQMVKNNTQLVLTQKDLEETNDKLKQLSTTDYLTRTYNRKHLDKELNKEIKRSKRYQTPLSLLMIDLDDFKQINDLYGHLIGDEVLIKTTQHVSNYIRETDIFGRWGGEEFMLICPNTNQHQAHQLAEKLLNCVKDIKFEQGFTQTTSIGMATLKDQESLHEFVERADKYLYKAKELGKNQAISPETEEIIF